VDEDGEPISSIVLEKIKTSFPDTNTQPDLTEFQSAALNALEEAIEQEMADPMSRAPCEYMASEKNWKRVALTRGIANEGSSDATKKRAFTRHREILSKKGLVKVDKEGWCERLDIFRISSGHRSFLDEPPEKQLITVV